MVLPMNPPPVLGFLANPMGCPTMVEFRILPVPSVYRP
jgi:hypothetical protein